ncbi:hypothetical protein OBBRIDRAFT_829372 [Obba rivulosa]|uniref:Uncharacterized protein n=1 Tax=Obba rivulosa TaxID=1052685 RepID=A0A8E2AHL0_9APHY|nr:hypothetical protein OBBRIDRAFT_829372 [Obba rivulosa]
MRVWPRPWRRHSSASLNKFRLPVVSVSSTPPHIGSMSTLSNQWLASAYPVPDVVQRQSNDLPSLKEKGIEQSLELLKNSPIEPQQTAIIRSWERPFSGAAADSLWQHIRIHGRPAHYLNIYPIIGPSSVGKSRLIDCFSSKRLVIPVNLTSDPGVFPPADSQFRDWMKEEITKMTMRRSPDGTIPHSDLLALNEFFRLILIALLRTTTEILREGLRSSIVNEAMLDAMQKSVALESFPSALAGQLHMYMTLGQTYGQPGILRRNFHERVLQNVEMLRSSSEMHGSIAPDSTSQTQGDAAPSVQVLQDCVLDLVQFCDDPEVYDTEIGFGPVPRVIVSFDGAQDMQTCHVAPGGACWSPFFSFIRAFQALHGTPVACLISSRTWTMFGPHDIKIGSSTRIISRPLRIIPFVVPSFDTLTAGDKFKNDGSWTLEKVTRPDYWVRLGRPVWGARYEEGTEVVRTGILDYAIQKLLAVQRDYWYANTRVTVQELFATLAPRLALEFKPSTRNSVVVPGEDHELDQVDEHLRLLVDIRPNSTIRSTVTMSSSEPTIVEAASRFMRRDSFESCKALRSVFRGFETLSRGFRGEHVVANLMIDALDDCTFDQLGKKIRSVVPVTEFCGALLHEHSLQQLMQSVPSCGDRIDSPVFARTFMNASMYVTHFVRVLNLDVLRREVLVRYIVRGAGVICSNGKGLLDLVLPFLHSDTKLTSANVSAILIRIQDEPCQSGSPSTLFDDMDPCNLGIFPHDQTLPVIRILLDMRLHNRGACNSTNSSEKDFVEVVPPRAAAVESTMHSMKGHATTFDIWCHGLSSTTFRPIKPKNNAIYADLLSLAAQSSGVPEPYYQTPPRMALSMWPGANLEPESWSSFVDL